MAQVAGAGDDEGLRAIAASIEANLAGPDEGEVAPAPETVAHEAPAEVEIDAEALAPELEPELEQEAEPEPAQLAPDTPWTIDELAEATGLTAEQFEQQFAVGVEGSDTPRTLADLRRQAKSEAELTRRAQEVAEERKQLDAARQHYQAQFSEIEQDAYLSVRRAEEKQRQLHEQMNGTNWQQIEAESGAAGVMQTRQAYDQLWQGYEQEKQAILSEHQQRQQNMHAEMQRAQQQALDQSMRELPTVVPEWRDADRRRNDLTEVMNHLITERGFPREMVEQTIDPRMLALAYDGMRYRRLQPGAKSDVVSKKVAAKAARAFKPGAKRAKADETTQRVSRIKNRLQRSGSVKDLAALRMEGFKKAR